MAIIGSLADASHAGDQLSHRIEHARQRAGLQGQYDTEYRADDAKYRHQRCIHSRIGGREVDRQPQAAQHLALCQHRHSDIDTALADRQQPPDTLNGASRRRAWPDVARKQFIRRYRKLRRHDLRMAGQRAQDLCRTYWIIELNRRRGVLGQHARHRFGRAHQVGALREPGPAAQQYANQYAGHSESPNVQ